MKHTYLSISTIILTLTLATTLMLGSTPDKSTVTTTDSQTRLGDPYTLDTCPISGMKLGSMGDPIIKVYDNREVRFCCGGCISTFEKNIEKQFSEIDKKIIDQQLPHYTLTTCIVSGGPLEKDGQDIDVNFVYNNRLIRVCCPPCIEKFKQDPQKYLAKLDEEFARQQREDYPLDTCVVGGGKLGSMGEPVEIVVANRLVRFCCAGCKPSFMKDPLKYFAMIDKTENDQQEQKEPASKE